MRRNRPSLRFRRPFSVRSPRPLAAALLLALVTGAAGLADDRFTGHWEGEVAIPGQALVVSVDLAHSADGWSGTIDIPAQGAAGVALGALAVEGDRVTFSIAGVPGDPTFEGALADGEIRGDFTQGPMTFPFRLGREEVAPPPRPQEPKPPFPYLSEEVSYRNGEVTLAGTLTVPEGEGPFPAAVLVTGSGAQNRDEELLGHKPFLVLADHLTRAGIAVLRSDDRGVGGSSGSVAQSTTADFAGDVLAAIELLRADPRLADDRIGVIGHSEGGLVGPLAATRSDHVAFVVMLAGPGVPGSEIMPVQLARVLEASGVGQPMIARQVELQEALLASVTSDADDQDDQEVRDAARRLVELQSGGALSGEQLEQTVEQTVRSLTTPWFRAFLAHDPRPVLAEVEVPVLALIGSLDLQVDAEQNLPAIERALAGNPGAVVRELPGLNHLFQHATTGGPAEYAMIEETFAPEALEAISTFILNRFGPRRDRGR
ncbi:MAG TPA: alpha/beta fold hydrolase [Thermoanaerobaculia bacterium]|nr:alpha/beta fold hydrolase [Thermoanaerobaculia bacterium]